MTRQDNSGAKDDYYREAESWAEDRAQTRQKRERNLTIAFAVCAVLAILEAIALVALLPLKTVVPYTLLVDRQTGYVQEIDPLTTDRINADEALTRSFLVQYVIARESYDIDTVEENYRKVALWSEAGARDSYLARFQPESPLNPFNRWPRQTVVTAEVKSVTLLDEARALVRYRLLRSDANGGQAVLGDRISVIRFAYSTEPMTAADRLINPLGFQVSRYRSDVEALPQAEEIDPETPVANSEAPDATVDIDVDVRPASAQSATSR